MALGSAKFYPVDLTRLVVLEEQTAQTQFIGIQRRTICISNKGVILHPDWHIFKRNRTLWYMFFLLSDFYMYLSYIFVVGDSFSRLIPNDQWCTLYIWLFSSQGVILSPWVMSTGHLVHGIAERNGVGEGETWLNSPIKGVCVTASFCARVRRAGRRDRAQLGKRKRGGPHFPCQK